MNWREYCRPIIAEVIRCCDYPRRCDLKFVKKAISASYPFGQREYWPYKVWCDEVRRQLHGHTGPCKTVDADPRQEVLFR